MRRPHGFANGQGRQKRGVAVPGLHRLSRLPWGGEGVTDDDKALHFAFLAVPETENNNRIMSAGVIVHGAGNFGYRFQ